MVRMVLPLAALLLLIAPAAFGQDDIKSLRDPALGSPTRPPALFAHDDHNKRARIADCQACHHVYKDGKVVPGESSAGQKCADCHQLRATGASTPLRKAYHTQCQSCHAIKKKGPLTCGGCHKKT